MGNAMKKLSILVVFQVAGALAVLTHPGHIVYCVSGVCSPAVFLQPEILRNKILPGNNNGNCLHCLSDAELCSR